MLSFAEASDIIDNQLLRFSNVGLTAIQLGKGGIRELCKILSNPQAQYPSIHIAGTNGKGTVATILYSLAINTGHIVGLYTSPYLLDFRESIRIGDDVIPEELVCRFVTDHQESICSGAFSQFEVLTAMAFWAFRESGCSIAIIEAGLGGQDDSTNILKPNLSIITNVGLDHTAILGDTIEEVAFQKAGICKAETPLLLGARQGQLTQIYSEKCREQKAALHYSEDLVQISESSDGWSIHLVMAGITFMQVHPTANQSFLSKNISTALAAAQLLPKFFPLCAEHYSSWYKTMQHSHSYYGLAGRWQTICREPRIVLDGAHNPAAWSLCLEALEKEHFDRLILVFGYTDSKEPYSFFSGLLKHRATVILTTVPGSRGTDPQNISLIAESLKLNHLVVENPSEALDLAKAMAKKDDFVLCLGSLYLIASLLKTHSSIIQA